MQIQRDLVSSSSVTMVRSSGETVTSFALFLTVCASSIIIRKVVFI
jgi:hypothetical protein